MGRRIERVKLSDDESDILETKKWTYDGVNIASVTTDDVNYDVYTVLPGSVGNVLERHTVNTNTNTNTTSNSRYYQYNHRGDVVMVTDASGGLIWDQDYTAFGHVASDDAGQWGGAAVRDDLMITGKDWDEELGLYYFNARWVDPELGRFISPTPLAPWVEEAYVYCHNNPVMWVDDNGYWPRHYDMTLGRGPFRGISSFW